MKGSRQYKVRIVGETPLLMHYDNIEWADVMKAWQKTSASKENSVAGDDRTPPWRWMGNLYIDDGVIVIPSDNLMSMLRGGGAKTPTGKRGGSYKRQTQSGLMVDQVAWPVEVNKKHIAFGKDVVAEFKELETFEEHQEAARKLGFELHTKRVPIGTSKHIRVRPIFRQWAAEGTITVLDETITTDVLTLILTYGGTYVGLGDWRPSAPRSPGSFGKFTSTIEEV